MESILTDVARNGAQMNPAGNGTPNGYHANGTTPTNQEQEFVSILLADLPNARKVVKQRDPVERTHFHNPQHGCAYGAIAMLADEANGGAIELQDVRTLLSTWTVDTEQPKNAERALDACEALNRGEYSCNGTKPDFKRALELANSIKADAPKPKRKAKPKKPEARTQKAPASEAFPLNETGNGERFAAKNAAYMRYCSVSEAWYAHHDGRWQPDNGEAERRAKQISQDLAAEAARETHDDHRARLLKHALTLTRRTTRETMLKDAASEPNMAITPEQFDANQDLFNLANGTINLQTFEFYPPRAADLLTLQSPIIFDAAAQCPTWRACMARWIPDEETRDYMQESFGVSLSGKVFEEFFNFLYGGGDNGKSTFLRVLEQLCGTYWHKTQAETIMQARDKRQANAPAPELLALKGARLVTVHEIDSKHTLNATLIKDLTGRDAITARGLFEKRPTTFEPQFTLWMFGNGKPRITDTSGGMWRRPRLIDFGQPIPPHERDPQLSEKLRAELPGILNWTLDGLRRVYERGLVVPEAVKSATAAYQAEQDPISDFIDDCCITGPDFTVKARDLWDAWDAWCKENGERAGTQRALGIELKRRKFEQQKSGSVRSWRGIGIIEIGTQGTQGTPFPVKEPIEKRSCTDFSANSVPCVPCVPTEMVFERENKKTEAEY